MSLETFDNKYTDKNWAHHYLSLYETLLRPISNTATHILELGVHQGGSIKLWLDYFPNASIYGCDIHNDLQRIKIPEVKTSDRIILHLGENAYTEKYVQNKFQNIKFDFLIDDGPHTLESQKDFIRLYAPLLNENGILIIEDILKIEYLDELINVTPDNLKSYIKTYDLRHRENGSWCDVVFVINKVNS